MTYSIKLRELFGSRAKVALAASVDPSRVSRWLDSIPHARCVALVRNAPDFGVDPSDVMALLGPEFQTAVDELKIAHAMAQLRWTQLQKQEAA
jgi:hypothetical protein